MSCHGCRVLRKGCKEDCVLRQCLQYIESPQAQAHATLFVAKFFGRAGLMSFISSVPDHQKPALFQSLLFEACGRTVNPVSGAVGLLWNGNWHLCQSAVETVLSGGELTKRYSPGSDGGFVDFLNSGHLSESSRSKRNALFDDVASSQDSDLDLCLTTGFPKKRRQASEESETTTFESSSANYSMGKAEKKLLRLFI